MFALPTVPQMIRTSNTSTSTSRLFHVVWPGARLTAKIRSELALFRLDELISSAAISTESKMKFLMINKVCFFLDYLLDSVFLIRITFKMSEVSGLELSD
ncbi:hypothetical protein CDAR_30061 [Caerostris darwini]|uniref:Uncharacterized protein n=1 Tax=Caerostris darwini TaxID=1538125 RepID=A0AAV4TET0_9ARAC|nr:hypothetical protein CDAR_30061 [Caerostris darwini]